MKLTLIRETLLEDRTIGKLYINDTYFCDTLEDKDRLANTSRSISEVKVKHETCIPEGSYKVVISFSPRFKQYLPLLLNVPGFLGIRIHAGNIPEHSSGCILLGKKAGNKLIQSRLTMGRFMSILKKVERTAPITIDIKY